MISFSIFSFPSEDTYFTIYNGLVLRAALGEMAVLVLKGSRVSSKSIMETGFEFEDTELEDILQRIIRERNQSK